MRKKLNLIGQKFYKLTVINFAYVKNGHSYWKCKCECGNFTIVMGNNLKTGSTKACGCFPKGIKKHGMCYTNFYKKWAGINSRCYNKKTQNYKNYGGRGITVCDRWKNSFENFRDDMYLSYKEHLKKFDIKNTQIDRINNDGNYELINCKWATCKEQSNNARFNHLLTYKKQTLSIAQWAEKLNINYYTLYNRIRRNWDIEKTLIKKKF